MHKYKALQCTYDTPTYQTNYLKPQHVFRLLDDHLREKDKTKQLIFLYTRPPTSLVEEGDYILSLILNKQTIEGY